jgi:hypothetical protein
LFVGTRLWVVGGLGWVIAMAMVGAASLMGAAGFVAVRIVLRSAFVMACGGFFLMAAAGVAAAAFARVRADLERVTMGSLVGLIVVFDA